MGKFGSIVLLNASNNQHTKELQDLAHSLARHLVVMRPTYTSMKDVPETIIKQFREEGGDKAVEKMASKDVFTEQELATIDENIKIKDYLKQKEQELKNITIDIKDWAVFSIG